MKLQTDPKVVAKLAEERSRTGVISQDKKIHLILNSHEDAVIQNV